MTNASATKDFVCRPLERDEWQSFKAIRLEALQKEPGVFGGILDIEKNQPQDYWEDWVHSGKTRCFGLFHGDAMIGCTGIVTDRTDATGTTALLIASYIQEAHRGRGLSGLLYKARLAYAANHPDWTRVIVSHRRSNEQRPPRQPEPRLRSYARRTQNLAGRHDRRQCLLHARHHRP